MLSDNCNEGGNMSKPLLTISFLSSGRPDTLWKCLDSLKLITDHIDSEIIIVDTGCSEAVRQKMMEYTDQIIPFTWCNDFSAARNVGLKAAHGEWFLYLDDDEWFVEVQPILKFFQSGKYKQYDTAMYYQRNFLKKTGGFYEDAWVSRMKKITPETHFVSSIHEYMEPNEKPAALVPAIVEHYGYAFDTPEENRAHSMRNIPLLLDMVQKEPEELRWPFQLVQEYQSIEEYDEELKMCDLGIRLIGKRTDVRALQFLGFFYVARASAYLLSQREDEGNCAAEEALADKRLYDMHRARLLAITAQQKLHKGELEACEKDCLEYLHLYNKIGQDIDALFEQGSNYCRDAFTRNIHDLTICLLIQSGLKRGNNAHLLKYFDQVGWNEDAVFATAGTLEDILNAMATLPYRTEYKHILQTLCNRDHMHTSTMKAYEKWRAEQEEKKKDPEQREEAEVAIEKLAKQFREIKPAEELNLFLKIATADARNDKDMAEEGFRLIFNKIADLFNLPEEYFEIAERQEVSLGELFETVPFDQWMEGIDVLCQTAVTEDIRRKLTLVQKYLDPKSIRVRHFALMEAFVSVIRTEDTMEVSQIRDAIKAFVDRSFAMYGPYYTEKAYTDGMEMLPKFQRGAVFLNELMQREETGDFAGLKELIEPCANAVPELREAVLRYLKKLTAGKREELDGENSADRDEMAYLKAQLRLKAKQLEETGNTEAAEMIRKQLEQY